MDNENNAPEAVRIEIDGVLDLHHFSPKDIKTLIPDYLDECLQKDILEVRLIHGKGKGVLKRTVEAILARLPYVLSFQMADPERANWGATIVRLKKATDKR